MKINLPDFRKNKNIKDLNNLESKFKKISPSPEDFLPFENETRGNLLKIEENGKHALVSCFETNAIEVSNMKDEFLEALLSSYDTLFNVHFYPMQICQYSFLSSEDEYLKNTRNLLESLNPEEDSNKVEWIKKDLEFEQKYISESESLEIGYYFIVKFEYLPSKNEKKDLERSIKKFKQFNLNFNKIMKKHQISCTQLSRTEYLDLIYYVANPFKKGFKKPAWDNFPIKGISKNVRIRNESEYEEEVNLSDIELNKKEKGINTLSIKNRICPYSIFENDDYGQAGDAKYIIFEIYDLPEDIPVLWNKEMSGSMENIDIVYFIKPEKKEKIVRSLNTLSEYTNYNLENRNIKAEKNINLQTQSQNIEDTFRSLSKGEKFYSFSMFIRVKAKTEEELFQSADFVESLIAQITIDYTKTIKNYINGFISILPLCTNKLKTSIPMLTTGIGNSFPLINISFSHPDGRFLGQNLNNNTLIKYNPHSESLDNGIVCITGNSGSGKSVTGKKIVKNKRIYDDSLVIGIDVDSENKPTCDSFDGEYIEVSDVSNKIFNIFEPIYDKTQNSLIAASKIFAISRIRKTLSLDVEQENQLSYLINRAYEDRGFSDDFETYYEDIESIGLNEKMDILKMRKKRKPPEIYDIYKMAEDGRFEQIIGDSRKLAIAIKRITREGDFKFWDGQTNIDLENPVLYFGFRNISQKYKIGAMASIYQLALFLKIKHMKRSMVILNEECKLLLREQETGEMLEIQAANLRKYQGLPIFVTQNNKDLLLTEAGSTIFTNASTIILMKQSTKDAKLAIEEIDILREDYVSKLVNLDKGECILILNEKKVLNVQIECSDYEMEKFRTDKGIS